MKIEIRGKTAVLDGYVTAVERDSRLLPASMCPGAPGPFYERVQAGVFQHALERGTPIELRLNHEKTLGGTSGGQLELYEDAIGLKARATITDEETIEKGKKGELRGWSFSFEKIRDRWEADGTVNRRYLEDIYLSEVSVLTKTPAYIGTTVEMRGEDAAVTEIRGAEDAPEITEVPPADYTVYEKTIEIMKIGG